MGGGGGGGGEMGDLHKLYVPPYNKKSKNCPSPIFVDYDNFFLGIYFNLCMA